MDFISKKNGHTIVLILFFITLILGSSEFSSIANSNPYAPVEKQLNFDSTEINFRDHPYSSDSSSIYSDIQEPLIVNETALLNSNEIYQIGNGSNAEYTSKNTSYFLDTTHGWQANRYVANISSVNDKRQWLANPDFGPKSQFEPTKHFDLPLTTAPSYAKNKDLDTITATINGNSCLYMRVHFVNISMESNIDYLYITDNSSTYKIMENFTGTYENILTPWYKTGRLDFRIFSDGTIQNYGFYIDYFEVYNGTYDYNAAKANWTFFTQSTNGLTARTGNWTDPLNTTALWSQIAGVSDGSGGFTYYAGDESGYMQNFSVPRGELVDAWFSLDYVVWNGIATNDMVLFCKINNQIIYTRGFGTINNNNQLKQWVSTGLINLQLWENSTNLFPQYLNTQTINISIGIRTTSSVKYSGFRDREIQRVYFDNAQLILKARANVSQNDINLTINNQNSITLVDQWGAGICNFTGNWILNPVQFLISTNSPLLEFTLNSQLFAWHTVNSSAGSTLPNSVKLTMEADGDIIWDWYHNVYTPPQYVNFAFRITKPDLWGISKVLDPTGIETSFMGGSEGDNYLEISQSFAYYPGMWHFYAQSINRIVPNQTRLWYQSAWINQLDFGNNRPVFDVNDSFSLCLALLGNSSLIPNLTSTMINLTLFSPSNAIWWKETVLVDLSGQVTFSNVTFGAKNTTAGVWKFQLLWTNGSSAGALNNSFEIRHVLKYELLYPKGASNDLEEDKIIGDLLAIRIVLNDSYTESFVSGALVNINWTSSIHALTEISSGIYDGSYDTSEFNNPGIYWLNFSMSKIGYYNLSFELKINLIEETALQVISEDQNVQLGQNFSLVVDYSKKDSSVGIENAIIVSNLSQGYWVIPEDEIGHYRIQINSSFFIDAGFHTIRINASKLYHQSQSITDRFNIGLKSVNFSIFVNGQDCSFSKTATLRVNRLVNLSIQLTDLVTSQPITVGSLKITNYAEFLKEIPFTSQSFKVQWNSSQLGMGIHFLSIIYNHSTYELTALNLQLIIEQSLLVPMLYETNRTTITNPNANILIKFALVEEDTNLPILGAQISYNWVFGSGFLTELTEGLYYLNVSAPSQLGSFEMTFTIFVGASYKTESTQITIINQDLIIKRNPDLMWVIILASVVTIGLLTVIIKLNVLNPRRHRRLLALEKRTQVLEDVQNIQGIMVIQKSSGLLLYNHSIFAKKEEHDLLVTGFLQAIMMFSTNISGVQQTEVKDEGLEFSHNKFNIFVLEGKYIRVALILTEKASILLRNSTHEFISKFEQIFGEMIANWDGDVNVFHETTAPMIEQIFHLEYAKNYTLTKSSILNEYLSTIIKPNTFSAEVFKIIETLVKDRKIFRLNTVLALIPVHQRLQTKDLILQLIEQKLIICPSEEFVKSIMLEEKLRNLTAKNEGN